MHIYRQNRSNFTAIFSLAVALVAMMGVGCGSKEKIWGTWNEQVMSGEGLVEVSILAHQTNRLWTVITNFSVPPTEMYQVVLEDGNMTCLVLSARPLPIGRQARVFWKEAKHTETSMLFMVPLVKLEPK